MTIINDAAVQKYFPGENPIGQRIGSSLETSNQIEIVGVLRDAKYASVREPPPPTMYVPQSAEPAGPGHFSGANRRRSVGDGWQQFAKRSARSIPTCR